MEKRVSLNIGGKPEQPGQADQDDILTDYERPITPDRELLVWEKWIQIRKEETTKLGERLKRTPADLAMNLLDKVREDKERKTILEHAQIERKPTVRGTFFERPARLKQRCYCQPVYEVHRTPAEIGHPGVIEHIGVPTLIKTTEMGMSGEPHRKNCPMLDYDYVNYRRQREQDLEEKILKIDPFRASTSKLIIEGHKPKTPPPKLPPIPSIIVDGPPNYSLDSISGVYAVRINNTILYKYTEGIDRDYFSILQKENWHEECSSWNYYFNVPIKRVGRGKLSLQNLGTVALRFCWKKIKRTVPFIPAETNEQVFFFNKNEDIISPGQSRDICFTFVSDYPGIYCEFWEIIFSNICFFDTTNQKITIDLYADSVEDIISTKRKVEILKTRIHRKSLNNVANDFINEVIDCVFAVVPQSYPYKDYFLEAQLFVMKNPVCFYHQTEVAKMKDLYSKEMDPGTAWDLSISTWRDVMMSKPFEDRMRYYDALKQSHTEFLKPWYEGDELLKEKYCAVNQLWGQLADKLDNDYDRLIKQYVPLPNLASASQSAQGKAASMQAEALDPLIQQTISNIFFIHTYRHITITIEQIAGTLSSLDSNRWIEFDFCRS